MGDTETRWADWIDLLTPYVVTGAAGGALRGAGASRGTWALFWFGTVMYTQGHGIHLAANSINNVLPGEHPSRPTCGTSTSGTTSGTSASTWSLPRWPWRWPTGGRAAGWPRTCWHWPSASRTSPTRSRVRPRWLGIAAAVVFSVWGLLTRDGMGRLLLTAYGFSGLLFLVFGLWQGGFPEFSELGWI